MTISKTLLASALAALAFSAQAATPSIDFSAGTVSSFGGAITIDFDSGRPANYLGGGDLFTGSSGEYAQPFGATGAYLSQGTSPASQTGTTNAMFDGLSYFGFYWGSPDTYNVVTVHTADNQVYTYSGTDLVTAAGANAPSWGNRDTGIYVNIHANGALITQVDFASPTQNALETDNHAYVSAVPEPETYAMLLAGLGMVGWLRRRKA
ncbi:MAG: PEP-CTERM sorting domain-containing protein [Sphingomonadaceae bacterium]